MNWKVTNGPDASSVVQDARRSGVAVFVISARKCQTTTALMKTWAKVLSFPKYFGYNWDATYDCLRDVSWRRKSGALLVFEHADHLQQLGKRDLRSLIRMFSDATKEQGFGRLSALFVGSTALEAKLKRLASRKVILYKPDPAVQKQVDRKLERWLADILKRLDEKDPKWKPWEAKILKRLDESEKQRRVKRRRNRKSR